MEKTRAANPLADASGIDQALQQAAQACVESIALTK
jgi:hypothetical protein